MRLQVGGMTLVTCMVVFAQSTVEPALVEAVRERMDATAALPRLRCEITPVPPALTFGLRFLTGYRIEFPLRQFHGIGSDVNVLVRVTPDDRRPIYLGSTTRLPQAPEEFDGQIVGTFVVGEGGYRLEAMVIDEANRVCTGKWRIQARRRGSESELDPPTPPLTVEALPLELRDSPDRTTRRSGQRFTILLHAAPLLKDRAKLYPEDVAMFVDSISTLLAQLPTDHIRLTVFNVTQGRVLLKRESLAFSDLGDVAATLSGLQFSVIDYQTLQNQLRTSDLLKTLLQAELGRAEQPNALIWLGPFSHAQERLQLDRSEKVPAVKSFYLQYRPPLRFRPITWRGMAELRDSAQAAAYQLQEGDSSESEADSIEELLRRIKGDTLIVRNPHDLASAVRHIEARLEDRGSTGSGSRPANGYGR